MPKIHYEKLTSNAFLNVVKEILRVVEKDGLFKKQHYYISFLTNHPSVILSPALKHEYPEEMAIILQYEFWDLKVDDYGFSVSLSFDTGDESVYIPFSAMIRFMDPSEDFCLEFMPDLSNIKQDHLEKDENDSKIVSFDFLRKK